MLITFHKYLFYCCEEIVLFAENEELVMVYFDTIREEVYYDFLEDDNAFV